MRALFVAFICVIFISPASAQDVYFCNTLENLEVKGEKITKYKLQNFKMLVSRPSVIITGDSYFNGAKFDVDWWGDATFWNASAGDGYIAFEEPFFNFAFLAYDGITVISARCDKF